MENDKPKTRPMPMGIPVIILTFFIDYAITKFSNKMTWEDSKDKVLQRITDLEEITTDLKQRIITAESKLKIGKLTTKPSKTTQPATQPSTQPTTPP